MILWIWQLEREVAGLVVLQLHERYDAAGWLLYRGFALHCRRRELCRSQVRSLKQSLFSLHAI